MRSLVEFYELVVGSTKAEGFGNCAGEFFAEFFIDFDNVFGGDVFDKVGG